MFGELRWFYVQAWFLGNEKGAFVIWVPAQCLMPGEQMEKQMRSYWTWGLNGGALRIYFLRASPR
jgi:hypothetical protein